MDHFGIGTAVEALLETYFISARRSGRTTSLVESLRTGDRVIFADRREAARVQNLCLERGVEIEILVIEGMHELDRAFRAGTSEGRTLFDHSWIEMAYRQAVINKKDFIDRMQRELSGFGTAHYETRARAREQAALKPFLTAEKPESERLSGWYGRQDANPNE